MRIRLAGPSRSAALLLGALLSCTTAQRPLTDAEPDADLDDAGADADADTDADADGDHMIWPDAEADLDQERDVGPEADLDPDWAPDTDPDDDSELTCTEAIDCVRTCLGDPSCTGGCIARVCPGGLEDLDTFLGCALELCGDVCSADPGSPDCLSCTTLQCWREAVRCFRASCEEGP